VRAVNLIPADQRGGAAVGAGRSEGAAYAVLGLLAGLALMALLYGMAHHQISSRTARVATLTAQAQQEQARAGELAPYTSFLALREQRVQDVSELVDSRFDWAHSFHELGRVLPREVSISSLSGTIGSATTTAVAATPTPAPTTGTASTAAATTPAVSSATPPGSVPTFTLSGCTTSQSEVALTLDRLRLIDGVSEVTLQSSTKGSGSAGGCSAHDPVFTVTITFDQLPSTSAASAAAASAASSSTATQGNTSTGGAR
jgi:Tfp pilus assembly protein PilN